MNQADSFHNILKREDEAVSNWLLFYSEHKKEYEEAMDDYLNGGSFVLSDMPGGSDTGDPTGNKGMSLARLQKTEKWLKVIEDVEEGMHPKLRIFLRLRQEYRHARGRRGWVAPVQWKYAEEVAKMVGKDPRETWIESRNTFTRWWDNIVKLTARVATKRGLL